jgi:hypothetical protein
VNANLIVIKKSFANLEGTKGHSIPGEILPPNFGDQLHTILILIPQLFDGFSPGLNCSFCLFGEFATLRLMLAALLLLEVLLDVGALFVLGKHAK